MSVTYRRQIERLFAHSAFYREKLRAAGFDSPDAVGGIENIAALPFTEKDELRKSQAEHPPLGAHAAIDISQAARIYSTSGTSGTPLYIPLTKSDVDDWRQIGRDTYSKNGLKAGERVVTTYGAGPFVAGASLAAFEAIGCTHIPVGVGNTEKLLAALKQLSPQALACTPSYAMYIAEKLSGARTGLDRIIVGGEPGGGEETFRGKLEAALGARVYEIMGIGDIAASLWGECEAQAGMHFSGEGIIHVELIDPEGQIAHHVLVDAHRPLEFGDRRRGGVDIEQHVVALAVLVHAIGEVAQAPILAFLYFAALLGNQLGKAVGQRLGLRAGNVLARDEHVFVKRHCKRVPCGCGPRGYRVRAGPGSSARHRQGEAAHYSERRRRRNVRARP